MALTQTLEWKDNGAESMLATQQPHRLSTVTESGLKKVKERSVRLLIKILFFSSAFLFSLAALVDSVVCNATAAVAAVRQKLIYDSVENINYFFFFYHKLE